MVRRSRSLVPVRDVGYLNPRNLAVVAGLGAAGAYSAGRSIRRRLDDLGRAVRIGRFARSASASRADDRMAAAPRPRGIVLPDGTNKGGFKVKSKTSRKPGGKVTLAKRVKALEKAKVPKSHKVVDRHDCFSLVGTLNGERWYNVPMIEHSKIETDLASIKALGGTTVDMTDSKDNTSVKCVNPYMKFWMKNGMTSNCIVEYCFFICKDDDNESPIQVMRDDAIDRGLTVAAAISAPFAKTATASEIPQQIVLTGSERGTIQWSCKAMGPKWKQLGKVARVRIGPGDDMVITNTVKTFNYKPERLDEEAFSYLANYDVMLVIRATGDLVHDTTNKQKVGTGGWQLDCIRHTKMHYELQNGLGKNDRVITSNIENTGIATPVHVDNVASAVENDAN